LYKTEIVELAKHLGIPNEIIKRIPSFDLWYRRTNENETGLTYQKLDKILKGLNKISSDPCEYKINGATKKEVSKIIDMIKRTKHKRELPPCLKI
jgi:NAD+ synthase